MGTASPIPGMAPMLSRATIASTEASCRFLPVATSPADPTTPSQSVTTHQVNNNCDYNACHQSQHHHRALSYITLHYITLHYITLHYITLHYITLCCFTLHYVTLHYVTLRYITSHYITLHHNHIFRIQESHGVVLCPAVTSDKSSCFD